jgi:hypothetical protein
MQFVDSYTKELAISLPIVFLLGTYMNKRYGGLYSLKFLTATLLMGIGLRYIGFAWSQNQEGMSSLTVAAALIAHTVMRSGLPYFMSLGTTACLMPFMGFAGPLAGAMFALTF